MSSQSKVIIITIIVSVGLLFGLARFGGSTKTTSTSTPANTALLELKPGDWIKGNPEAKVSLVEYLDFECEACRAFFPFVKQLQTEFPQDLRVITRYFPLPGHKNSFAAALAVEAAGQQGKYWEMHDMLFEKQDEWGNKQSTDPTLFVKYAEAVGLDMVKFKADTESSFTAERVRRDQASGNQLGANATPTFFLNGKKVEGVRSYDQFKSLVEAEIAK